MSFSVLVLEDDRLLAETLEDFLETLGYTPHIFMNAKDALRACYENIFNLYLLDINIPDMSGLEFLTLLRESGDETPAIYITSSNDTRTLIKGYDIGADDYIKKPFDLEELACRVKAVLERTHGFKDEVIIDEKFRLDLGQRLLYKNDLPCDLNPKDFELLLLLVENSGKIVTKEMIAKKLWSASEGIHEGAVRVYINNIKKFLGKNSIENIRSIGYRFVK